MEFDENDAIKYMRENVSENLTSKYDDDELINLIDIIYDYYEANGLLELDFDDEDDDLDVDDLCAYAVRMLRKDPGAQLSIDDVPEFINAYLDYENSLE